MQKLSNFEFSVKGVVITWDMLERGGSIFFLLWKLIFLHLYFPNLQIKPTNSSTPPFLHYSTLSKLPTSLTESYFLPFIFVRQPIDNPILRWQEMLDLGKD